MRSILLYLMNKNLPLAHWEDYRHIAAEDDLKRVGDKYDEIRYSFRTELSGGSLPSFAFGKDLDNAARVLVNATANPKVVERMAVEWESFPPQLRLRFTAIANEMRGHASGNITKGIARLDALLSGKILARETGPTERSLQVVDGRKVSVDRRINPAVAGAYRAFSGYALPPNFSNMSKAEQKRVRTQLAAERRELKRR